MGLRWKRSPSDREIRSGFKWERRQGKGRGRRGGQEGDEDKLCGAVVRHIALRARPSWVQVLDMLLNSWVALGR